MKKGLILTNAYSSLPSAQNQAKRLKEEFLALGVQADILRNDHMALFIDGDTVANGLDGYDFCVYLDKDKYVSHLLEKSGLRLFNTHSAIQICDDKMQTHIALAKNDIPMPRTLPGLLCYTPEIAVNEDTLDKVEKVIGYPIIVKECYGSLGKGVYKAESRTQLKEIAEKLKTIPHLYQQCITESLGRDIRVIVIGTKPVCAMMRQSKDDFRSNIGLGGTGTAINIDDKLYTLCSKVAEILHLDYCGIDVLLGKDGYLICEVNSNAFFGGIEAATGVNVAKIYAKYICDKI